MSQRGRGRRQPRLPRAPRPPRTAPNMGVQRAELGLPPARGPQYPIFNFGQVATLQLIPLRRALLIATRRSHDRSKSVGYRLFWWRQMIRILREIRMWQNFGRR